MTRYTRIEWIRGGSDPPDQPAGGTLSLQEITGLQYRESVERRPQEIGEITPIECQQNIGPRRGRKQDRPVACRRKHRWPFESQHVRDCLEFRAEQRPAIRRACGKGSQIGFDFGQYVTAREEAPALRGCSVDDRSRCPGRAAARGEQHARIQKNVHDPLRYAARSRSSSLIQACISADVKLRGAGNGRPSSRRLAARDSSNRRRSSALRRLAADSISVKLPMDARLHLSNASDNTTDRGERYASASSAPALAR